MCSRVFYENVDFPDRQPLVNYILASSVNFLVGVIPHQSRLITNR